MGLVDKLKEWFSAGPTVSNEAVIWAFDIAADRKELDEYDLIVMFSENSDLPIFLQVKEEMYIPEGTLAYRSLDNDWAMDINNEIVPAIPCMLIPPSQKDDIDTTQPDVIEVPNELTGGNIPASADKEDDLTEDELIELT